jgi:GNAT superfamily N-acetyltransferase
MFDPRRDLLAVANLIEVCFTDTLDEDGQRYLRNMRQAAHSPGWLGMNSLAAEWGGLPFSGFVWEQGGRLVGNVSLVPYRLRGQNSFLIANVAVHPDYRRRGIARSLTVQAIEHLRQRRLPSAWLHVRRENRAAVALYQSLGFEQRACRTTWRCQGPVPTLQLPPGLSITRVNTAHWTDQRAWLLEAYPQELSWNLPLDLNALHPGIRGSIARFFGNYYIQQWEAQRDSQPLAFISWQSTATQANALWLAASTACVASDLAALLLHARSQLPEQRPLALDYSAGMHEDAIQAAGFSAHQTLIWMELAIS